MELAEDLLSERLEAQDKERLRLAIQAGQEALQVLQNGTVGRWFRDFNDAVHDHLTKLDPKDKTGREHLNNLLHVCWLFRKGLEHYAEEGDTAQIELRELEDRPKKPWWKGGI